MGMDIEGEMREIAADAIGGSERVFRLTQFSSVPTTQVEPPGVELTRYGRRFWLGNYSAIAGIAPAQVFPTNAAQWTLWNTDKGGGRTAFFEELGMYLTSGAPGVGGILLGCLFNAPFSIPDGAAGAGIGLMGKSSGGKTSPSSGSVLLVRQTVAITDPAAPVWYPLATLINLAAPVAFPGSVQLENRNLQGALALPPQTGLGLAVVGPAGTAALYAPFARWVEIESTMR